MITDLSEDPKIALKGKPASMVSFFASWCGDSIRCYEYEKALAEEFKDKVAFCRFDAVEYEDIADSYGIEHYPTYIFFIKGKPTKGILVEPVTLGQIKNWLEIKLSRNKIR